MPKLHICLGGETGSGMINGVRSISRRMVVYSDFIIPAHGFRIGRAFSHLPGVRVELDRIVPTANAIIPFIWVRGAEADDVVQVAQEYGAVEEIVAMDKYEESGQLFRVVWNRKFRDALVTITESDIALLSGKGTQTEWRFEFRAMNRESLSAFHRNLRSNGVPVTVVGLTEVDLGRKHTRYGLTDPQVDSIRLAFQRGYFNEPRDSTLSELASEVGISRQAFGGRLRRGIRNLIADTVLESRE